MQREIEVKIKRREKREGKTEGEKIKKRGMKKRNGRKKVREN